MPHKPKKKTASMERSSLRNKQILSVISVVAVFILVLIGSYYLYRKYDHARKLDSDSTLSAQEELRTTVEKVSRIIELPSEQPTLATVSDKTKLAGQSFFAHAQNGDKVLIYPESKKAYLYRPSVNKIIEVTTLLITSSSSSVSSATEKISEVLPLKVIILNGTTVAGLAARTETVLSSSSNIKTTVIKKDDAASSDYSSTIVVSLKEENKAKAEQIADIVQGTLMPLPESESVSDEADIIIILGKNTSF